MRCSRSTTTKRALEKRIFMVLCVDQHPVASIQARPARGQWSRTLIGFEKKDVPRWEGRFWRSESGDGPDRTSRGIGQIRRRERADRVRRIRPSSSNAFRPGKGGTRRGVNWLAMATSVAPCVAAIAGSAVSARSLPNPTHGDAKARSR